MNVFVSPFNNPFINLALEDFFLRGGADLPVLLFYVNRPCVVLGRFQNPWLECNLSYLVEKDIWMVRRQSGGGCVFHDEGNLNYSFIYPEGMIDRRAMRFLAQGGVWNHIAMEQAIRDSGLEPSDVSNERTGIVTGWRMPSQTAASASSRHAASPS